MCISSRLTMQTFCDTKQEEGAHGFTITAWVHQSSDLLAQAWDPSLSAGRALSLLRGASAAFRPAFPAFKSLDIGFLATCSLELLDNVQNILLESHKPSTDKAYELEWKHFSIWTHTFYLDTQMDTDIHQVLFFSFYIQPYPSRS